MKNLKNVLNVLVFILLASTLYNCSSDDSLVSSNETTEQVNFRINSTNFNYEDILADAGFALSTKKASTTDEAIAWIAIEVANSFDIDAFQSVFEETNATTLGIHFESEGEESSRYIIEFQIEEYASLFSSLEVAYTAGEIIAAAHAVVYAIEIGDTIANVDEAQLIADIQFATGREVLFLHFETNDTAKSASSSVKAVTKAMCCDEDEDDHI